MEGVGGLFSVPLLSFQPSRGRWPGQDLGSLVCKEKGEAGGPGGVSGTEGKQEVSVGLQYPLLHSGCFQGSL